MRGLVSIILPLSLLLLRFGIPFLRVLGHDVLEL